MEEMKAWQHGYPMDYLVDIQDRYAEYNKYALGPFLEVKKNKVAQSLHEKKLKVTEHNAIEISETKVKSAIKMHGDTVIGHKLPGDITFTKISNFDDDIMSILRLYNDHNCWLYTWAEWAEAKQFAKINKFKYIGCKVSSFAEVQAIYFRDAKNVLEPREHPTLLGAETVNISKCQFIDIDTKKLQEELSQLDVEYTNHYSNYNKGKSWSAISLRGYKDDVNCIVKPLEMDKKWKAKNEGWEDWQLQDVSIRNKFPYVNEIVEKLPTSQVHRIRFMALGPGGGELSRHTDQVDPTLGVEDGKLMRLHIPVVTNPNMIFSSWDMHGQKHDHNMKEGEMWYLDIRKPHMAINNGDATRIHLVIDVEATKEMRDML
tara:strand:- start:1429 stop:2547 length:1119 start_codon:yes stop_codon:yes gene_type:complete